MQLHRDPRATREPREKRKKKGGLRSVGLRRVRCVTTTPETANSSRKQQSTHSIQQAVGFRCSRRRSIDGCRPTGFLRFSVELAEDARSSSAQQEPRAKRSKWCHRERGRAVELHKQRVVLLEQLTIYSTWWPSSGQYCLPLAAAKASTDA